MTKEFIDNLLESEKYLSVREKFKDYLKTAAWDRSHIIAFDIEDCEFVFGEVFHICDRADSLIVLNYGDMYSGKPNITLNGFLLK